MVQGRGERWKEPPGDPLAGLFPSDTTPQSLVWALSLDGNAPELVHPWVTAELEPSSTERAARNNTAPGHLCHENDCLAEKTVWPGRQTFQ
jgi:hypothetical protein